MQRYAGVMNLKSVLESIGDTWGGFANNMRKILTAAPCPKCGVMISKNGGCSHVGCSRCKHEFCWVCMGDYYAYRHGHGMEQYC